MFPMAHRNIVRNSASIAFRIASRLISTLYEPSSRLSPTVRAQSSATHLSGGGLLLEEIAVRRGFGLPLFLLVLSLLCSPLGVTADSGGFVSVGYPSAVEPSATVVVVGTFSYEFTLPPHMVVELYNAPRARA